MSRLLPPNANPESLKKEAKRWLKSLRAGYAAARERLAGVLPDAPAEPGLRHVQFALAREFGFPGWSALQDALADLALARRSEAQLAEELLRSAWEGDLAAARRIFARRPEIARHDLWTATLCGDRAEVERRLARTPDAARTKGGPRDWEPLLYLAYGRIAGAETDALAIAELLLAHGGDPSARFDDGWGNAFTLITGVIGQGETDRREHPHAEALAELFIARGADPFDTQTLYDTSLNRDETRWLDFLWRHVAARGEEARWSTQAKGLDGKFKVAALDYLLGNAVASGHVRRAEWLLDHGADPDAIHAYSGRPLCVEAQLLGHGAIAEMLARFGARPVALDAAEHIVSACAAGDLDRIRMLARTNPGLLQYPMALIRAAQQGNAAVVALLLELGTDPDLAPLDGKRALHWAAQNDDVAIADALIAAGSDIDRRGSPYKATPLGFAVHFGCSAMIDLLAPLSKDVLTLAYAGRIERLDAVLAAEPDLIESRNAEGQPLLFVLPEDEDTAVEVVRLLLAHGANPRMANASGETAAQVAELRGLDDAAALIADAAERAERSKPDAPA